MRDVSNQCQMENKLVDVIDIWTTTDCFSKFWKANISVVSQRINQQVYIHSVTRVIST